MNTWSCTCASAINNTRKMVISIVKIRRCWAGLQSLFRMVPGTLLKERVNVFMVYDM